MLTKEQIDEWLEDPITQAVKKYLEERLEEYSNETAIDCLDIHDSEKTFRRLLDANARVEAFSSLLGLFQNDLEEIQDEPIGD